MPVIPVDVDPTQTDAGTATGAGAILGPMNMAGSNILTRGKTVVVACSGTAFSTTALQGSFDSSTWFTVKDIYWSAASIATTGVSHLVLGASYPFLKVVATGGSTDSVLQCSIGD